MLANEPLAFLDPGAHETSRRADLIHARDMDFSLPGFGSGEIDPAVNIAVNSNGQIETREYGAVIVRLNDVRKK